MQGESIANLNYCSIISRSRDIKYMYIGKKNCLTKLFKNKKDRKTKFALAFGQFVT